jgi:hypothetical protein
VHDLPVQRSGPQGNRQRYFDIANVTPALYVGNQVLDIKDGSYVVGKITCYTPPEDTDENEVGEPLWRIEFDNYENQDWTRDELATGLELCNRLRGSIA